MTALQFPTTVDGRDTWTDEQRLAELRPWHRLVTAPGGQDDRRPACATRRADPARRGPRHHRAALARPRGADRPHPREAETRTQLDARLADAEARAAEGQRLSEERLLLAEERLAIIETLQQRVGDLHARIARKDQALRRLRAEHRSPPT